MRRSTDERDGFGIPAYTFAVHRLLLGSRVVGVDREAGPAWERFWRAYWQNPLPWNEEELHNALRQELVPLSWPRHPVGLRPNDIMVGEPNRPLNLARWPRDRSWTDWTCTLAGFWFGGKLHPLGGVSLKLLAAFLGAPEMRLSNAQIVQACTDPEVVERPARAYVCDLNSKLRDVLHLPSNPVQRIGQGVYQFSPPV
jgi:hypothetical protein